MSFWTSEDALQAHLALLSILRGVKDPSDSPIFKVWLLPRDVPGSLAGTGPSSSVPAPYISPRQSQHEIKMWDSLTIFPHVFPSPAAILALVFLSPFAHSPFPLLHRLLQSVAAHLDVILSEAVTSIAYAGLSFQCREVSSGSFPSPYHNSQDYSSA